MIELILSTIYLLLPAYTANMAPVIAGRLDFWPNLNKPIDNDKKIFGQPIFGAGKTWRGLLVGTMAAILTAGLQAMLYQLGWVRTLSPINFFQINWFIFGLLAGLGALLGDMLKSLVKRQFHITSGQAWPVFDQLDFLAGFIIITWWLFPWHSNRLWVAIIITLIMHPLSNVVGYLLKIKKVWW
jgi:CDP-2,3-bis-(O-geranylgeranyl)-sn-glycerol synthase